MTPTELFNFEYNELARKQTSMNINLDRETVLRINNKKRSIEFQASVKYNEDRVS